MFYYNPSTGQFGITLQDVRRANLGMCIPDGTTEAGDFLGYEDTTAPEHDPLTHFATETTPVVINGQCFQQWIITARDAQGKADILLAAQDEAWRRIAQERDRRIVDGGVKVGEHWFFTTLGARSQYALLDSKATRNALPDNTVLHPSWKTMGSNPDGSRIYVPMTVALLRQIIDAGIDQEGATFDAAETHAAAMRAAADPAAYDFSTGWPVVFGEL